MITGYRKGRGLRWINWRSVRFLATVGIVSTIISHISEGETRPVSQTLTEAALTSELNDPRGALRRFVTELEDSICMGDAAPFTRAFDHEALLSRATSGVAPGEDSDRIRAMFRRGTLAAWQQTPLVKDYLDKHFRLLRPHTIRGHEGLLFRAADEGGGLNYYLLMLAKTSAGEFRIQDVFVVGVNETISATLGRTYRHLVAEFAPVNQYPEVVEHREVSEAFVASLSDIAQMNRNFQMKNFAGVLETYAALPAAAQRDHKVMLMRVEAAEQVGHDELVAAIGAWERQFPDERNLPLKFIDFYSAQGDYAAAERVARNLNEDLGGDPYLKFRLGEILLAQEVNPGGAYPVQHRGPSMRKTTTSK